MINRWPDILPSLELLLCPPGSGVYVHHTNRQRKLNLQEKIYGMAGDEEVYKKLWRESLKKIPLTGRCLLLGICSDNGGGILRGANWGPLFIRQALLDSRDEIPYFDLGDVRVIPHLLEDHYLNEESIKHIQKSLYGDHPLAQDLPVSPLSITEKTCQMIYDSFPSKSIMGLGGDHSVSYPLVKTWLNRCKFKKKKAAVIHFDAHTDLSVERLGIDVCFGSWAYHILPLLDSPDSLVQLGIRSSAKDKAYWEKTLGVKQFWADELEENPAQVAKDVIAHLKSLKVDEVYITFDIDCLDITYAGATGTPEKGGPGPHAPMLIMQEIYENFSITGADLVEVAPMTRPSEVVGVEPETTLMMAQSLVTFLIGALSSAK